MSRNGVQRADYWQLPGQRIRFGDWPAIMGIVNVTPDSFSDGGQHASKDSAVQHALQLVRDGADILDIGGESTRPYSEPVDEAEELQRVIPVIEQLAGATDVPISIDSSKSSVAQAAIDAGAHIINDVTGLEGDPGMIEVARSTGAAICAMHMQGTPQTMQENPTYGDVVEDVIGYLQNRLDALLDQGIERDRISLDPGIGFGKTHEHNLQLVRYSSRFIELGCPILVGHSRKGFIGRLIGDKNADRDIATAAVSIFLARQQIQIVRVHNVAATRQAFRMLGSIEAAV